MRSLAKAVEDTAQLLESEDSSAGMPTGWSESCLPKVPNSQLRHIRLENNENKPVTNSRDTQEVPLEKAKQVLKIIASYKHTTSVFDDFKRKKKVLKGKGAYRSDSGEGGGIRKDEKGIVVTERLIKAL